MRYLLNFELKTTPVCPKEVNYWTQYEVSEVIFQFTFTLTCQTPFVKYKTFFELSFSVLVDFKVHVIFYHENFNHKVTFQLCCFLCCSWCKRAFGQNFIPSPPRPFFCCLSQMYGSQTDFCSALTSSAIFLSPKRKLSKISRGGEWLLWATTVSVVLNNPSEPPFSLPEKGILLQG